MRPRLAVTSGQPGPIRQIREKAMIVTMLVALNADADVRTVLGDPARSVAVRKHRVDLVVASRMDGGADGVRAIASIRTAL
jgi:hypothetical protein